ncbi:hypothetical protein JAAARDRAFT_33208 [Jaapia argillacea MUCL 33604]|uniref:Cytokinin riboside 5'-monophosphate phosphoribohydrolase n=1 Tax=Jaapia argillacea MUCL 33604 TaxID=933084 RepID=A0A067PXT1_9AGAM|nr:hypothetical protein JAAARDRAFT_33208 [Jaapia argillacea MUCL 33604]
MTISQLMTSRPRAVAVFCASSTGTEDAYQAAAVSLGRALAKANRPLVYGGGSKGLMGVVSGAALEASGKVTGVVPIAMVAAGGEASAGSGGKTHVVLGEKGREAVETIVVNSMHERKVEMARRAGGFVALPGGFGTYEEVLEATTWTQIAIHNKPIVILNVLSFYDPLRSLVRKGLEAGFIQPQNESLIVFVDGPSDHSDHQSFDWGSAALDAVDTWRREVSSKPQYDWSKTIDEGELLRCT